jgi:hypothetical protein
MLLSVHLKGPAWNSSMRMAGGRAFACVGGPICQGANRNVAPLGIRRKGTSPKARAKNLLTEAINYAVALQLMALALRTLKDDRNDAMHSCDVRPGDWQTVLYRGSHRA